MYCNGSYTSHNTTKSFFSLDPCCLVNVHKAHTCTLVTHETLYNCFYRRASRALHDTWSSSSKPLCVDLFLSNYSLYIFICSKICAVYVLLSAHSFSVNGSYLWVGTTGSFQTPHKRGLNLKDISAPAFFQNLISVSEPIYPVQQ